LIDDILKKHLIKQNGRHLELEIVADNLSFPTSIAIDDKEKNIYVAESGLAFDDAHKSGGRVLKIGAHGRNHAVLIDQLKPPVTGLTFYYGDLYISEGGHPPQIIKIKASDPQQKNVLLTNLPGPGNYHTNMMAFGPDSKMYFSQGAMTNTGIIGLDAYELGWLRRLPHACDIPGYDITLAGANFETIDPRVAGTTQSRAVTGAFVPFATPTLSGQRIKGQTPCTASIMRCDADGKNLELVAWGLRNCFGIGFLKDGRLLATDQGPDDRGSRPIGNAPDFLYEIRKGSWYGWPDFIGGIPITDKRFAPRRGQMPTFLLSNHDELPSPAEKPLLSFPANSAPTKFDVARGEGMGQWSDHIFVALFGDEKPMTAPSGPKVGRAISRVDPSDWSLHPFIEDQDLFERPIDLRFEHIRSENNDNNSLLALDFGRFEMDRNRNVLADAASGKLWRVIL
jgi:glucose/arabinose dehydrogenase